MSPLIHTTDPDIVTMLLEDHRNTEAVLDRFKDTLPEQRADYFAEFVPMLLGHEVAEEGVVYPALRSVMHSVEIAEKAAITASISEGSEIEERLKEMESMDPAGAQFAAAFAALSSYVIEHAKREEQTVFPLLDRYADVLDRGAMGSRYIKAKRVSPVTRPLGHPW